MRVRGDVSGDVAGVVEEQRRLLAAQLRAGMVAASDAVQADLRNQVRAARLGVGLERAWAKQVYPRSASRTLQPAALVFSKSTVLHSVFTEGATVVPRRGRFLAVPTREAEAMGLAETRTSRTGSSVPAGRSRRSSQVRAAAAKLGEQNLRYVPLKRGRVLVVYRVPTGRGQGRSFRARGGRSVAFRRGQDVALFVLVPQVRLAKRLDFAGAEARAEVTLAAEMDAALASG